MAGFMPLPPPVETLAALGQKYPAEGRERLGVVVQLRIGSQVRAPPC